MSRPPRLAAREVTVRYGNFEALRRVSVEFRPGEVHAVVGQNGAGKSTLMRVLAGEEQPTQGEVCVDGIVGPLRSPLQARQRGISIVHQHFELVPGLSVAENMALGHVPRRAGCFIDRVAVRRGAQERLAPFGLSDHADRLVRDMPMAERQLVEIARALGEQGRVLILDEPTAALSHDEAAVRDGSVDQGQGRLCHPYRAQPGGGARHRRPHHRVAQRRVHRNGRPARG